MTDPAKPTYWYPRPKRVELKHYISTQDADGKERRYRAQNEELMQAWLDGFKPGQEQGWYDELGPQDTTSEEDSWAKPQVKRDIGMELGTKIREAEVQCEVRDAALAKAQAALEEAQVALEEAQAALAQAALEKAQAALEEARLAAQQAKEDLEKLRLEVN